MSDKNARARRALDKRFARLRPVVREEPRPHRGWIRAIRDALGMSGPELAARMGVTQQAVATLESREVDGVATLRSLGRAAAALNCDVAYFLIPRTSLDEMVTARAREKAAAHLASVAHHGRLEDQALDSDAAADELDAFAARLVDRHGLWSDEGR